MAISLQDLKEWAREKKLGVDESIFLLGSVSDQITSPSDLDILFVSEKPFPPSWIKELFLVTGLPLDLCIISKPELMKAGLISHHPLAIVSLALKNQATFLCGSDFRPEIPAHEISFIEEARKLQGYREWDNFQKTKKLKYLKKVILSLAICTQLIPSESGASKIMMEKEFLKLTGPLPEIYHDENPSDESIFYIQNMVRKTCYPSFLIGRCLPAAWSVWDLNGSFENLLSEADKVLWRQGHDVMIELKLTNSMK